MNITDKADIYSWLASAISKSVKLETVLLSKKKFTEAAAVAKKTDTLAVSMRKVRQAINDDWKGAAKLIKAKLKEVNADLSDEVNAIKDIIDDARRIVKAIGQLDKVIGIAASLLL